MAAPCACSRTTLARSPGAALQLRCIQNVQCEDMKRIESNRDRRTGTGGLPRRGSVGDRGKVPSDIAVKFAVQGKTERGMKSGVITLPLPISR
jgi:hypothetical protein